MFPRTRITVSYETSTIGGKMLSEGTFLQNNRYRVEGALGQGGMGAVYRAWHTSLEIPVAIKEMTPQPGLSPEMLKQLRAQFKREANILARLSHSHLVHVMDSFEEGENAYLVMEMVSGDSMAARIRERGAIPEAIVMQWAQQLLDALAYCHGQGIIHRDIKPHNIIIRSDDRAVLVDFGLVKLWDPHDPYTKTAMRGMGTPEYAPPEQYDADAGHTDARSDIYSLGATLYHALAGKAPPTATTRIVNPQALMPVHVLGAAIQPQVEQALMRAMELRPIDRFQSAQEMATALRTPTVQLQPAPQRQMPQQQVATQQQVAAQQARSRPASQPMVPPQPLPSPYMASSQEQAATAVLHETPFTPAPAPADTAAKRNWMAVVALLLSLGAMALTIPSPYCNLPAILPGIILGFLGRRSRRRKMATWAIVICVLALLIDIGYTILLAYMYSIGQLDWSW